MKNNSILVIGGNGKTGRKVATQLTKMGYTVRIGSRSQNPSFDWNNMDTWVDVLQGMDSIYITYQPDLAVPSAKETIQNFTKKAKETGIKKMVILSGRGEAEAEACEQIVLSSGIDSTVIRCDWFNQNFSESFFLEPILEGHLALPRGEAKIPFIDTDDIAEVAVKALTEKGHEGQIYELTGARLLTFEEVTKEISKATGRKIKFQAISLEAYTAYMRENKIPDDFIWLVEYLFINVLDGRNANTTNVVEKVLGRQPKDFSEYAKQTAATGVWDAR